MRKRMIGTGWKMNMTSVETLAYANQLLKILPSGAAEKLDIFVLPPFTSLHAANTALQGSGVLHGGQNMHWAEAGAWTGEVSAAMLLDAGCRYVELAHSERLEHFGETYGHVRRKVDRAVSHGLTPILCVGELGSERDAGRADSVLREQIETALAGQSGARAPDIVIAYEPRWAIGAEKGAEPGYAAARHASIRTLLRSHWAEAEAERIRIIYGGSVTPTNGSAFLEQVEIDGLFSGRAAWRPEGLAALVALGLEPRQHAGDKR